MFGFLRRKKSKGQHPGAADPLVAFDQLIEDFERQATEVRKAAATLLALRGELTRASERYTRRIDELASRKVEAEAAHDKRAIQVFERDEAQTRALLTSTREALGRAESDGKLLLEAAGEIAERVGALRLERTSASARLAAGTLMSAALRERVEQFDKVLAVDAARDEVERAHALADIYREQQQQRVP